MGLGKTILSLLFKEGLRKPFSGRMLALGKQDLFCTENDVRSLAKSLDFPLNNFTPILSQKSGFAQLQYISSDCVFKALGFQEVESMDFSDFEGATYRFDLNSSVIPEQLARRFEFIFDGGTMEHVFHIPNLLTNIHAMLSVEGRIFHSSPASNYLDHGFYSFSPTFFHDYYRTNRYNINDSYIIRATQLIDKGWKIYKYAPGLITPRVQIGGLDDGAYNIAFFATKQRDSCSGKIPQQSACSLMWEKKSVSTHDRSLLFFLKNAFKRSPVLYFFLRGTIEQIKTILQCLGIQWPPKGIGLKPLNRGFHS